MRETNFKQTEVGSIPISWEARLISDAFSFVNNNTLAREQISEIGAIRNIHYGDILVKYGSILDIQQDTVPYIKESIRTVAKNPLRDGDILMADTAEDETVGKCCEVHNICGDTAETGLHTFGLRAKEDYAPRFLGYAFNAPLYHNQLLPLIQGTKVSSVSKTAVSKTYLCCPSSIEEQRKIAQVLSDIDGLISSFTKLIEKKKNIKTATMQLLLTGKKRLEDFTEPWVEKRIGEIAKISKGQSLQSKDFANGHIPVIAGGQTYAGFHNIANHKETSVTISASGAYAGYVWLHEYPIFASDCSVIEGNDDVDIHFLYNVLKLKQGEIYKSQTGGAQPHIHPKDIEPIKIVIPFKNGKPNFDEQRAIGNILTEMDNEISALEQKRAKYENIKKGMMQELLTGRIRLV